MSITSGDVVSKFYKINPYQWVEVNLDTLENKAQADEVNTQCISDGRMERLKAIGCFSMGSGAVLGLGLLALLVTKVATLVAVILTFPLMVVPPLHLLVTTLCGFGVGAAIGYITIKRFAIPFFIEAKQHWNYGDHLFQQAHAVRMKKAVLN